VAKQKGKTKKPRQWKGLERRSLDEGVTSTQRPPRNNYNANRKKRAKLEEKDAKERPKKRRVSHRSE